MIGGDRNVRRAAANHAQYGPEHASYRGDLPAVLIPRGRQCVVVPEQLVRAVDQMDSKAQLPLNLIPIAGISINLAPLV